MASATRQALAGAVTALAALKGVDRSAGEQVLSAGRLIGDSLPLRNLLADPAVETAAKQTVVSRLFGGFGAPALALITVLVVERWSSQDDLLAGFEEIGIRAIAATDGSIDGELFAFARAVASNNELELAVGSKLGNPAGRLALVISLLGEKASAGTIAIVSHLVQQPRGRRIGRLLQDAAEIVADQAGDRIATVTSATTLTAAQLDRVRAGLAARYGGSLRINQELDPGLIGGIRIQIGDDVIDGSVSARINALRLQLAG